MKRLTCGITAIIWLFFVFTARYANAHVPLPESHHLDKEGNARIVEFISNVLSTKDVRPYIERCDALIDGDHPDTLEQDGLRLLEHRVMIMAAGLLVLNPVDPELAAYFLACGIGARREPRHGKKDGNANEETKHAGMDAPRKPRPAAMLRETLLFGSNHRLRLPAEDVYAQCAQVNDSSEENIRMVFRLFRHAIQKDENVRKRIADLRSDAEMIANHDLNSGMPIAYFYHDCAERLRLFSED